MTNNNTEQFSKTANQGVDTAHEFIQASLESIEKLTKLQLEASKKMLDQTSAAIKDITSTTDPKDLFEKINKLAAHSVENNLCNCRDVYTIMTDAQATMGKLFEVQLKATQQNMMSAADGFAKLNPSKTNTAAESVKNWINTTNQAINAISKVASQVTEFTTNNIQAATAATTNAVKKASGKK